MHVMSLPESGVSPSFYYTVRVKGSGMDKATKNVPKLKEEVALRARLERALKQDEVQQLCQALT